MKVRKVKSNWTDKEGYISLNTFLNEGLPYLCDFIQKDWIEHTQISNQKGIEII